jgi:hypothetical protein
MSDSLVSAAAQISTAVEATFATLPLPLEHRIFWALPADARGRASCVCRAWRDVLAEPALWTSLDMAGVGLGLGGSVSAAGGFGWQRFLAVLRGAAGRARGQLVYLDVSQDDVYLDVLLPVLTANAGSLRELHLRDVCGNDGAMATVVEEIVPAAPLLQVLTAKRVRCTWEDAPRLLRGELPCALQMRGRLEVDFDTAVDGFPRGMERVAPSAAALAEAALQPALFGLQVRSADTAQPAVMGALADAAVARRLRELSLEFCTPPAAAPLARLLAQGSLALFDVEPASEDDVGLPLFDAAGAALVADALRVNTTLIGLHLRSTHLCRDIRTACAVLGALVGHPSLRELRIYNETFETEEDRRAFGAALAALIAADAPALRVLDCAFNTLGDAGLAPIVEALALNCHLRELDVTKNGASLAFMHDQLVPELERADATLREFRCEWHFQ